MPVPRCWSLAPSRGLRHIATLPLLVAGTLLVMHRSGGLDWLVAGLILCVVVSLVTAWILWVEILG